MSFAKIKLGSSLQADPILAVRDLHRQLSQPDIDLVIVFCSPQYDLDLLGKALREQFQGIQVVGCTTAGEIGLNGYQEGGLSGLSVPKNVAQAVVHVFSDLSHYSEEEGCRNIESLRFQLEERVGLLTPANAFGLLLIDGLAMREDIVARSIRKGLGDIAVVGGSAGDDLMLRQTLVFHDGHFENDAGLLILFNSLYPFKLFNSHHFVRTAERLVVTSSDPASRTVNEIDGYPAAEEYARQIQADIETLSSMDFAAHPMLVRVGNTDFVRSIQRMNADHSLTFFCAIDTGIVMTVAEGVNVIETLEQKLSEIVGEIGQPQVIIGCDCILRNLEIKRLQQSAKVSSLFKKHNVISFNTYGEQCSGMHVNQTFTGIAIGEAP